jgi:isopentenyldiphosphate isomerase
MSEEILDLVNEQDEVVGSLSRREIYERGLTNFRVVHGFLVNKERKLWIPRRILTKKIAPGGLDYSVAGHVESGESYENAFRRETQEELGIDVDTIPWKQVAKFTPSADGVHFFEVVYEMVFEGEPQYSRTDFGEAAWYTPEEALALIRSGGHHKMDLAFTIEKLYLNTSA